MTQVEKTIYIRRGNVLLETNEDTLEKYLADGYDQVDEKGQVIKAGVPNDTTALRKKYEEQKEEIRFLKEKVETLEKALEKAKNSAKKTTGSKA